ncbi:hypothetical protein [Candidatus Amarobacter glycogenicus]|uniref:hypothetical protein n=1 Tax=Candidatus Amarobacter glycogenicus TaxID=3140699 RepID=UPI002A1819D2|nr:hypothetical protein [Dehalococcoidia bacterium]
MDLANAPDDTKVKATWTAVAVTGADPSTVLDDVELTSGSNTLTFDLDNANPWPAGDYQVELFLNGASERTLTFRVSGGLGQAAPEATTEPAAETAVASGISSLKPPKAPSSRSKPKARSATPKSAPCTTLPDAAPASSSTPAASPSPTTTLLPARRC